MNERDLADLLRRSSHPGAGPANGSSSGVSDRPPLRVDEGGVVRVGRSRVSLDTIVEQYENGMTPEEMVLAYDTLRLADAHAAITFYLTYREDVQSYLARRNADADELRANIEAERPRVTRAELLARRGAREEDHAPSGQ